jgi:hypothetical protein
MGKKQHMNRVRSTIASGKTQQAQNYFLQIVAKIAIIDIIHL